MTFRAALVGAGHISEFHAAAIRDAGVELVGLCDLDPERARSAAARLETEAYPDLEALREAGAEVIHVLTPPSAHAEVALAALELGCHVLIEKPLAEDVDDCRRIGALAAERGLVATVNHSLLFDPQVVRAFEAIRSGSIGEVVSVDILRGSEYPPFEGGPLPPHYRDPGYPFRDLGVHCLYLIQALLGPIESVEASYRSLGGDPNLAFDEWRALVSCAGGLGQFQLSWNVRPMQSQLIIHGTSGVLRVDLFSMFHGKRASTPLPRAAERVINTMTDSLQPLIDMPRGVIGFVRKRIQAYQGLRDLVAEFYRTLAAGEPPPVSIEEATSVVDWTERVARAADADGRRRRAALSSPERVDVLVTGASGGLGSAIVARLRRRGLSVRSMVRRVPAAGDDNAVAGNLGDPEAVDRAVAGARIVVHAGAAMSGPWPEHLGGTVVGTTNVVAACVRHGVDKLVHISSMSVVDWAGSSGGEPVSEDTPLEPRADQRGAYTRAKLEAERIVAGAAGRGDLAAVILRPGQIFGGRIPLLTGAVARRVGGAWLVLGDGELELPLVYIDDVVDAVELAIDGGPAGGEIIQLVDPRPLTQNQVLARACPGDRVVRVPRPVVFAGGALSEPLFRALGRQSPVAIYRLRSALARLRFSSDRAGELLGWQPRVGVDEGIRRVTGA